MRTCVVRRQRAEPLRSAHSASPHAAELRPAVGEAAALVSRAAHAPTVLDAALRRCVEQRSMPQGQVVRDGPLLQRAWYTNPLNSEAAAAPLSAREGIDSFLIAVRQNKGEDALRALSDMARTSDSPSNADEGVWPRAVGQHLAYLKASPAPAMASFRRLYLHIAPAYVPDFRESTDTQQKSAAYNRPVRRRGAQQDARLPFDEKQTEVIKKYYVEGDLFYGLATARERYMRALVDDYDLNTPAFDPDAMRLRMPLRAPLIVDTISNTFMGTGAVGTRAAAHFFGVSGSAHEPATRRTENYEGDYPVEHPLTRDFREFLESNPRRDPRTTPKDDAKQKNLRIGRSSKGGIAFTLARGGRVHFILDADERGPFAVDRILKDVELANSERGITGKELRWIFRNRSEIGDRVVFWKHAAPCRAPWEQDPGPWKSYEEHSRLKHAPPDWPPPRVRAARHKGMRLGTGVPLVLPQPGGDGNDTL